MIANDCSRFERGINEVWKFIRHADKIGDQWRLVEGRLETPEKRDFRFGASDEIAKAPLFAYRKISDSVVARVAEQCEPGLPATEKPTHGWKMKRGRKERKREKEREGEERR